MLRKKINLILLLVYELWPSEVDSIDNLQIEIYLKGDLAKMIGCLNFLVKRLKIIIH